MNLADAPHDQRPDDVRRAAILTKLASQFTPGKVIDLATGAGWFARIMADLGWHVTAIDARDREWEPYSSVTWRHQDVRDADLRGYDLILCLGIFYHLTLEDQLVLLSKCEGTPLILDTHVALPGNGNQGAISDEVTIDDSHGNGYTGKFLREDGALLASWQNDSSFWPTEETQERMLRKHGYSSVTPYVPWWFTDRTFFTCLP
jgi:hypothetical protein